MLAIYELVVRSPLLGQLSFWVKFWTLDSVLCSVINRVSAKLVCFTYFIFLCASYFNIQFEFKIKFLNTGEFSAKSDKTAF